MAQADQVPVESIIDKRCASICEDKSVILHLEGFGRDPKFPCVGLNAKKSVFLTNATTSEVESRETSLDFA